MLGMTAASGSVSTGAAQNVAGFWAVSVGCTSARCVIVGNDAAGTKAKTAFLNPASGSVKVSSWSSAAVSAYRVACPDKTTCLGIGFGGTTEVITAVSTQAGPEKVTAKLPGVDAYTLLDIACAGSAYCWVDGNYAPATGNGSSALLLKVSPAGKILDTTVNTSYYEYQSVACESGTTCLIARETSPTTYKYQSMTLVNGKFGRPFAYPVHYVAGNASCFSDKLCYSLGASVAGLNAPLVPEVIPLNPKTGAPGTAVRLPFGNDERADSIACYSATQCVVVGEIAAVSGGNPTTEAAYVVITKGKLGKLVVASTDLASIYGAVSCASATECYAVGTYYIPATKSTASVVGKV